MKRIKIMKKGQMYLWNCINKNLKELEDGKIAYLSY